MKSFILSTLVLVAVSAQAQEIVGAREKNPRMIKLKTEYYRGDTQVLVLFDEFKHRAQVGEIDCKESGHGLLKTTQQVSLSYSFESREKCYQTIRAIAQNEGKPVEFTLKMQPPDSSSGDQVVKVDLNVGSAR